MQFFFDHIIASVVAIALGLTILAQQMTVRQDNMERTSIYHAKSQSLAFAEWVEDDVVKLGARFGTSRQRFDTDTEHETRADGQKVYYTNVFEYFYNSESDGTTATRVEVRYEVTPVDSVLTSINESTDDSTYVPLYALERSEREGRYTLESDAAPGAWEGAEPAWTATPGYGSPSGLRYFRITPMDSEGGEDVPPAEADYVKIEFEVLPTMFPLHRSRLIPNRPLHWQTTIEIRPF